MGCNEGDVGSRFKPTIYTLLSNPKTRSTGSYGNGVGWRLDTLVFISKNT